MPEVVRGRCIHVEKREGSSRVVIRGESGDTAVAIGQLEEVHLGDLVEARDGQVRTLTPNRAGTTRWMEHVLSPRRRKAMATRARVEKGIRDFFTEAGF